MRVIWKRSSKWHWLYYDGFIHAIETAENPREIYEKFARTMSDFLKVFLKVFEVFLKVVSLRHTSVQGYATHIQTFAKGAVAIVCDTSFWRAD